MLQTEILTGRNEASAAARLRIGIDFDNTLINYDRVFVAVARERGLVPGDFHGSKRDVRDAIRLLPEGELAWQRLQGHVYGAGIGGAVLFEGIGPFLRRCRALGIEVFIVSHKTRYGHLDPARIDLREAALGWMAAHGFFSPNGFGLRRENVFFEETRAAKLARIAALDCTHFIDDLEEVFADPGFPPGVQPILFAKACNARMGTLCRDWGEIVTAVLGDAPDAHARAAMVAGGLLGAHVDQIEPVRGAGRNSRVFRVSCDGKSYALKHYPPDQGRSRDRLGTEGGALELMNRHGITAVPKLIDCDAINGYLLFEWIDGTPVAAPGERDIDAAVEFLAQVHALRREEAARAQPFAAEACLSGAEVLAQIERRVARLLELGAEEPGLARLLGGEAKRLLADVTGWAEAGYRENGLAFGHEIEASARTLCPADFGFHNAMRRPDGRLVFIDFDYFGWDDPAKLASDFLLHPGMSLSEPLKRRFGRAVTELYGRADPAFAIRLRLLYPLFALRWCMILLNEFLPERWTDRVHAGAASDWETVKRRQLDRAREWVQSLAANFRWFPYGE